MEPFTTSFTIEWGDCDEAGIVFYPNYFYLLDCSFQRFLRSRGLGQRQLRDRFGAVTPLVDAGLRFRAPARYDDLLTVELGIGEWQERKFRIGYRLTCGERLVAEGHELRAWAVTTDSGLKGAPVSEEFRRLLA